MIDFRQRYVDVESTVCLREGLLELIACTKGTKEHESIVVIHARPMHIHLALLLLSARNGNPAMRKPTNEDGTQWIDLPPRGDPVDVYLVLKSKEGKVVERPISDFVVPAERKTGKEAGAKNGNAARDPEFPHTFLFAGSLLREQGPGPRHGPSFGPAGRFLSDFRGSAYPFGRHCFPYINEGTARAAAQRRRRASRRPKTARQSHFRGDLGLSYWLEGTYA